MPKKHNRHHANFTKPSATVHPSLSSSPSARDSPQHRSTSSRSVNEILSNLRVSQSSPSERQRAQELSSAVGSTPTVHPSLKQLLQVADLPPPRPRPGSRPIRGSRRGPAGPPPPQSWLAESRHAPAHLRLDRSLSGESVRARPHRLASLPELHVPCSDTLVDVMLKHIASNWQFFIYYDQYNLKSLPPHLKSLLLTYISMFGPERGIDMEGLETLFPETDDPELTHLDLSLSVGDRVSFKQLGHFIRPREATVLEHKTFDSDSWETQAEALLGPTSPSLSGPRFPCLTHLSLAYPHPNVSWPKLLSFASKVPTLTHLSLAYWPIPCVTPNSKTATLSSPHRGTFQYGSSAYAEYEDDWAEAAGVLWRLSRGFYCLKWLSLEGCGRWIGALLPQVESSSEEDSNGPRPSRSRNGPDWTGTWRGLETIVISRPPEMPSQDYSRHSVERIAHHSRRTYDVIKRIRRLRQEAEVPWLQFQEIQEDSNVDENSLSVVPILR